MVQVHIEPTLRRGQMVTYASMAQVHIEHGLKKTIWTSTSADVIKAVQPRHTRGR
ncbi:hypothetical protein SARC_17977, partial [Sphaeroforma arctica JP610]